MNFKDIISSGILNDFVMGFTSEEDTEHIIKMAQKHPEVQDEIESIQHALGVYGGVYKEELPETLKNKIWQAIEAEATVNATVETIAETAKVVEMKAKDSFKWLAAASVTLLIASSILSVIFYNNWQQAEDKLLVLNQQNQTFADKNDKQLAALESLKYNNEMLTHANTKSIRLEATPNFEGALATVYWNAETEDVMLIANNLPEHGAETQYQLWAIVDGKPVDAGMIDLANAKTSIQKMKGFKNAQAFAITLEKKGGSPTPNMDQLHVLGEV